jgi:Flp pilus assembly protein TadG
MTPQKISKRFRLSPRDERGQTMVEFALVLPILAVLLFGVIQFGIAFNNYITITDAARAAARRAAVSREAVCPSCEATNEAKASAENLDQTQLNVSVSPEPWAPGSDVTVTVKYPYSIHILGLYDWTGWLTSKVTERVE